MSAAPQAPRRGAARPSAPTCAWCGSPGRRVAGRLAICDACGAATTYPPPDDAELEAAYGGWYRPSAGRFAGGGDMVLRRSRATLARRVDALAPSGPVLDVGCGEGALLDALHARGREPLGLERTSARPDVRACEVTAFEERVGEWAAVVFWHSLEHLRAPAAALDRARDLLAPGGLLVLAVPNRASWQARAFGGRWFALDIPRHVVHLPAATVIAFLRDRELRIERVSYWRGGQVTFGWLEGFVGALPGHPSLYDAIRRPQARRRPLEPRARLATLAAGVAASPVALALAVGEVVARAGGTVYLEARRP